MADSVLSHLLAAERAAKRELRAIQRLIRSRYQPSLFAQDTTDSGKVTESPTKHIAKEISNANYLRYAIRQLFIIHSALYTAEFYQELIEFYKANGREFPYSRDYFRAFLSREKQKGRLDKDPAGRYYLPMDDAEAAYHLENQRIAEIENEEIEKEEEERLKRDHPRGSVDDSIGEIET